jgi:hypothetical protein
MLLEEALRTVSSALGAASVEWAPLKGISLGRWLYARPLERPTTDLDVLITENDLPAARLCLGEAGWTSCLDGPAYERYLVEEGYNWKAVDRLGVPLELHYRLWGSVPDGLGDSMMARSSPNRALGVTARQLDPVDEFLVGAIHFWLTSRPRPLLYLWDLRCLLKRFPEQSLTEISARSNRYGLNLMTGLAASLVARHWDDPRSRALAKTAMKALKASERPVWRCVAQRRDLDTPTWLIILGRLLAGRPSRSRARVVLRALWPHPGIAATVRSAGLLWPVRSLSRALRGTDRDDAGA